MVLLGLLLAPACSKSSGRGAGVQPVQPVVQSLDRSSQYPGQSVTLKGAGFTGADQVNFGTVQALKFTIIDDSTITAVLPAGLASGPVPVTVHTSAGLSPASVTLTVLALPPVPVVAGFDPPSGAPGRLITLTGTGFLTVSGVRFGGVAADPATITAVSDTTLTVKVPAGASGAGLISVVNPGGPGMSNGDFTVALPPTLASFLPNPGLPGTDLVLTGTGFTGVTSVLFATATPGTSVSGTIQTSTDTRITLTVPATAATGPITVETPQGAVSSAPDVFTVTVAVLTVADFNPKLGAEGTVVTVSGANLGLATGVTFGGSAAVSGITLATDGASFTVTVPPGAVSGPVVVQVAGAAPVTVSGGAFTVSSPALAVNGFSSALTGGVLGVTITGANLGLATGVTFAGGVTSTAYTVAPGGASLTLPVPAGAVTGPVGLLTAGGPVPVPGGALTVPIPAAAPVITGFVPPQGVPGTEVTLTGSGFTGATLVAYAGMPLNSIRYDLDSDTQLRLRVPDDAQANGTFTVATPAGPSAETAAFILAPSRRATSPQPLVGQPGLFGVGTWLNYPADQQRAGMYNINLPQAPVFHAYNPSGEDLASGTDGNRAGHFATQFSLNLRLPTVPFLEVLPASIQAQLAALAITPANTDLFVTSQDYQFDGVTPAYGVYLFRPHYWTDPTAPYSGIYYVDHNLSGGIFEAAAGVTISAQPSGTMFNFPITSHGPDRVTAGNVIASGNTEPMAGFDVSASSGLWSLVYELPPTPPQAATPQLGRAAVTLHLLFNDADQAALNDLALVATTVQQLVGGLALSPTLSVSPGVQMFLALARPVVNTVTQTPVAGTANQVVVLTGSCLASPIAVQFNGADVPFEDVSDAIVKVTLPVGAAGPIVVVTAIGQSDPATVL
jgi:hypothetical protein